MLDFHTCFHHKGIEMKKGIILASLPALLLSSSLSLAAGNFDITLSALGQTENLSFAIAEDSLDSFDSSSLEATFSGFNSAVDTAQATLNFRGLEMQLSYPEVNGSKLALSIPSLGINEEFSGSSREESADLMEDYFKGKNSTTIKDILKALAASSSVDPIAGNPSSLMSVMVADDFDTGMNDNETTNNITNMGTEAAQDNQIGYGLRFDKFDVDGREVTSYNLPLSYTIRMDNNPRHQIKVSMPISYSKAGSAETYKLGLGIAYSFPAADNWSLTPSVSYGLIGSPDLASAGAVMGISLTSRYQWNLSKGRAIVMGNSVGQYETQSLEFDDYDLNPEISNTVYTNGLSYNFSQSKHVKTTIILTDTMFSGDRLYVERTDELGVVFSPRSTGSELLDSYAKIGFSYIKTDADNLDGFRLRFSSSF